MHEELLFLPHPEPKNHARMARENRAAQFAPFAALTGYEEAVEGTARKNEESFSEENFYYSLEDYTL